MFGGLPLCSERSGTFEESLLLLCCWSVNGRILWTVQVRCVRNAKKRSCPGRLVFLMLYFYSYINRREPAATGYCCFGWCLWKEDTKDGWIVKPLAENVFPNIASIFIMESLLRTQLTKGLGVAALDCSA